VSQRGKQRQKLFVEAVIESHEGSWSDSTKRTARSDAHRILEALVAEYGVEKSILAMNKQGFEGKAYSYLLKPMHAEARSRRPRSE
jgi:hypothetical protein